MTPEDQRALDVARALIAMGVPIFAAPPALDDQGQWDPKGGTGGCGYWLPTGWEKTVATTNWLDPTVRGFEHKAWRPGWALCLVGGHGFDVLDTDPRSGGHASRERLVAEGALPQVYAVAATPSGGTHEFVASLGVGSRDGFLPGLDFKGGKADETSRGFVFIAPTVKRSKTTGELVRYRWTREPTALREQDTSGEALAGMVALAKRPAPPRPHRPTAVVKPGRDYTRWTQSAVDGITDDLRASQAWPEGVTDDRGRGWQKLCADAAMRLGQLARADWCPLNLEQARDAFMAAAPRGASFDPSEEWRRQSGRGEPAEPPPAAQGAASEVASWLTEAGVRVDPILLKGKTPPPAAVVDDSESQGGRESQATQLVRLARARYVFGQSTDGDAFGVAVEGPQIPRMLRHGAESLRGELSAAYFLEHGKAPSQSALADCMSVLEGLAMASAPVDLHLRVAAHEGAFWLDRGDSSGQAIELCPGQGWAVRDAAPVLFRRTALTAPLPLPVGGGDLSALWEFVNIAEADRPLMVAVLVASLDPEIPHPVVVLDGEQGSGKSSSTRVLGGLIDPSTVPLRKPPSSLDGWTTAAAGSWVVPVDNLSDLKPWLSDAMCRAATGDGDVQRQLYTNGGLYVVSFRRCVLLNGIDLAGIRDDLADRAVMIHLERLTGRYRDDAALARQWVLVHPLILGALLDLAVQVLGRRDAVKLEDPPRMVDFARILAAVDDVMGTRGLARYRSLAGEIAADAVNGDPVLSAIGDHVRSEWTGTAAQLLDLIAQDYTLSDRYTPRDWPSDARAMSALLRRRAPSLRRLGWTVEDLGRGGRDKQLRWGLCPPAQTGITAGIAGNMPAKTGISDRHARTPGTALTCGAAVHAPFDGHDGHPTSPLSLLDGEEKRAQTPHRSDTHTTSGEAQDLTPAMPATPAQPWEPEWAAAS